jgi:hypothetical protein
MNPYRLDDMDVFSNLLFVKDSKEKLSVLAHQSERIDKYRPETCCIIGNVLLQYAVLHCHATARHSCRF